MRAELRRKVRILKAFLKGKAVCRLEYDLPDERWDFEDAYFGTRYKMAIDEVMREVRGWIKWGHKFKNADEALEAVQDIIREDLQGTPWEY